MAEEPRAVTVARVSLSKVRKAGQLVALARQTADPFTKMAPAFRVEPEAEEKEKAVVVAFVVMRSVTMAEEALNAVVVTFVVVTFVKAPAAATV